MPGRIDTALFIERAINKHGTLFKYDLVSYKNNESKVKIRCPNGHIFEQSPTYHLKAKRNACVNCQLKNTSCNEFIELSKKKYGDKTFDYSTINYTSMNSNITLRCQRGHIFTTNPTLHLREKSRGGCRKCQAINEREKNSYTQEKWIELATIKHSSKYNYSKVSYINNKSKVCILCPTHGEYSQVAGQHLRGSGCHICWRECIASQHHLSEDELNNRLEICASVHKNKYTYGGFFRQNTVLFINVICPLHGSIPQRLNRHIVGYGCYKCSSQHSLQQIDWLNYRAVSDGFIQHARNTGEYRVDKTNMTVDGFNNKTNTIYEYQGDFWHGNPSIFKSDDIHPIKNITYGEIYNKTKIKIDKIKSLGYTVIEVWETDWKKGVSAVKDIQRVWRLHISRKEH